MAQLEAIILAGGFGSRLQGVVKDVPKPMADINGKPFLSFIMDYLIEQDVNKVLLSVGYKHEIIMSHFGSRYKGITIQYVIEGLPLGTGGAVKTALQHVGSEQALVINGDTLFRLDLNGMMIFHHNHSADLTIAVKPMKNIDRYGTLMLDETRIIGFQEKTFKKIGYINGGVYILNKKIFNLMPQYQKSFSFEIDLLENVNVKLKAYGFISDTYFIDIGIPEDYERAKKELR